jgi:Carboxypeptidase regulatory-like domain
MRKVTSVALLLAAYGFAACSSLPCAAQDQSAPPATKSAQPDDKLCAVGGTVLSANTGEPLRKAHIRISERSENDNDNDVFTATTDAAGHFSVEKMPAGQYEMQVRRDNYMPASYPQKDASSAGGIMTLTPGQKMTDLVFRLHKTGVVTGKILDEDGDPLRRVQVTATNKTAHSTESRMNWTIAETNDLGEYRLYDLAPGRYTIFATPIGPIVVSKKQHPADIYQSSYYPGVPDAARASLLDVKSGDEITGIDFALPLTTASRTYKVSGHITNTLAAVPDSFTVVWAVPHGSSAATVNPFNFPNTLADRKTGDFEILGVPPGDYGIVGMLGGRGRRKAIQYVTVAASDVENVALVFGQGANIRAHLIFDGKAAASAEIQAIFLEPLKDEPGFLSTEETADIQPDGTHVWKDVPDGTYNVAMLTKCTECYVKSASANGIDVQAHGAEVSSGSAPQQIDIVYSSNSGTLGGTVTNKDDLPAAAATVVVVPEGNPSRIKPEKYKTGVTDQYGHFEIRGIPPGSYKAYAWEKLDTDSLNDVEYMKPYESAGEAVDLNANDRKTVELKMIPATDAN